MICEKDLPEALNLPDYYLVHQIGPPPGRSQVQSSNTKDNPRHVLMRFLDFTDNEDILSAYCRLQTPLQLRGFKILIFTVYSAEFNRKRRTLSSVCTALHKNNICFQLLYPAILKIKRADDTFLTQSFLKKLKNSYCLNTLQTRLHVWFVIPKIETNHLHHNGDRTYSVGTLLGK